MVEKKDMTAATCLIAASVGVCLLLVVASTGIYILARPAVPRSLLKQLTVGMSKPEVQAILGESKDQRMDGLQWNYSRWGNSGWVEIHFDQQGKLDYVNDESAFP